MNLPTPTPLPNESLPAFRAFAAYAKMGAKRSIRAVACGCHKSASLCARWSRRNHWQSRLRELEVAAAEAENERCAIADTEAKKKFAERIEAEKLRFAKRQIAASEAITRRALEILRLPLGDSKPAEAARLFAVGQSIGAAVLGFQSANGLDLQAVSARQVTNIVVTRDEQTLKTMRIYADYFRQNRSHPQAERYIREYEEELQARGLPLDCQPEDAPPQLSDGETEK
jgi:hypothetical protein